MPDANTLLMQSIHSQWGAAIAAATDKSSIPPAFLAALVANESGGKPSARRFEKGVLAALWEVLQGRAAAYGSIGAEDLRMYILSGEANAALGGATTEVLFDRALGRLDQLATSQGLTQIMGYEAIPFQIEVSRLQDPASGLQYTLRMLAQFAVRSDLDLSKDFSELFDEWNTGRPHAPTADPQYIPNGLARMAVYQTLLDSEPPKAVSA